MFVAVLDGRFKLLGCSISTESKVVSRDKAGGHLLVALETQWSGYFSACVYHHRQLGFTD